MADPGLEKDAINEVKSLAKSVAAPAEHSEKFLSSLKESQINKCVLRFIKYCCKIYLGT